MVLALEGITILDLSRYGPGHYATMLLADLGADVIKVEQPGERLRAAFAQSRHGTQDEERIAAYNAQNRNKRSLYLNLKVGGAREVFYQLCRRADVLFEGNRPGVAKRLGIDYQTISRVNPRMVYCSLSGYGQEGPYKLVSGHDLDYIAVAGALGITGEPGRRPTFPANLLADYAGGGMHAALGILAALMARGRTGRGQYVDIAMTDGVLSLMNAELSRYFSTGQVPQRGETTLTGSSPVYNVYETKDGKYIAIASLEPWFWENLCRALGHEEFIPYEFARGEKREEVFSAFRKVFATRTRDEWFEYLKDKDVCVAPVYTLDEVCSDPQVLHREMVVEVEHPKFGKVKQLGISVKLSETPGGVRRFAPFPGQHTREILLSLGYTEEAIEKLRKEGAIT